MAMRSSSWAAVLVAIVAGAASPGEALSPAGGEGRRGSAEGTEAATEGVLARVDGVPVRAEEVEALVRPELQRLRDLLEGAHQRELELQVNSLLLEQEARRRGISPAELLQEQVVAGVGEPSEAEARQRFEEQQLPGRFEEHREALLAALRFERERGRAAALADELRRGAELTPTEPSWTDAVGEPDRVLAVVEGRRITAADVQERVDALAAGIEREGELLRRRALELRINDLLLQQEAGRRETSVEQLLAEEVARRTRAVGEAEARAYFEQNREHLGGDWSREADRSRVYERLYALEARRAQQELAADLRSAAAIEIATEPAGPGDQALARTAPGPGR